MNKDTIIVLVILIVILIPAIRSSIKHLKGEGDCCGGPKEKVPKKKLDGPKIGEIKMTVEGMHCVNCKNRIEKKLNEIDGVVAKVNLNQRLVRVSMDREVNVEELKNAVESVGYTVVSSKTV